jgi:hypothetical protein
MLVVFALFASVPVAIGSLAMLWRLALLAVLS